MTRKRKLWRYSAGEYPCTVEVRERTPRGVIYVRLYDPSLGRQARTSLRHRDREAAIAYAEEAAKKLRAGVEAAEIRGPVTVGQVLTLYLAHRTPAKQSAAQRRDDERRAQFWLTYFGAARVVARLGEAEWNAVIQDRRSGLVNAKGALVADASKRQPIGPRGVDADLVFLIAVFNWALSFRVNGRALLAENPWGSPGHGIKRLLERPRNRAPKRPVATYDRYLAVHAAACDVWTAAKKGEAGAELRTVGADRRGVEVRKWMRRSYLPELLELVEQTGRRISAICQLQYDDIRREGGEIVAVRWRPFKRENEQVMPVTDATRATLERIVRARPGMGAACLFPRPLRPTRPIDRHLARDWLVEGERLAGVAHLEGGSFHPYRRKWGTERKHHPTADVMAAGGWRDERSLKESYQMSDEETTLAVLNEPRKLMSRKAG